MLSATKAGYVYSVTVTPDYDNSFVQRTERFLAKDDAEAREKAGAFGKGAGRGVVQVDTLCREPGAVFY